MKGRKDEKRPQKQGDIKMIKSIRIGQRRLENRLNVPASLRTVTWANSAFRPSDVLVQVRRSEKLCHYRVRFSLLKAGLLI